MCVGLQGNDPHYYRVIATPKHFAVHSGPEIGRHSFDVDPSLHDLWDTYLPAFRAAIVDAKGWLDHVFLQRDQRYARVRQRPAS